MTSGHSNSNTRRHHRGVSLQEFQNISQRQEQAVRSWLHHLGFNVPLHGGRGDEEVKDLSISKKSPAIRDVLRNGTLLCALIGMLDTDVSARTITDNVYKKPVTLGK